MQPAKEFFRNLLEQGRSGDRHFDELSVPSRIEGPVALRVLERRRESDFYCSCTLTIFKNIGAVFSPGLFRRRSPGAGWFSGAGLGA